MFLNVLNNLLAFLKTDNRKIIGRHEFVIRLE